MFLWIDYLLNLGHFDDQRMLVYNYWRLPALRCFVRLFQCARLRFQRQIACNTTFAHRVEWQLTASSDLGEFTHLPPSCAWLWMFMSQRSVAATASFLSCSLETEVPNASWDECRRSVQFYIQHHLLLLKQPQPADVVVEILEMFFCKTLFEPALIH